MPMMASSLPAWLRGCTVTLWREDRDFASGEEGRSLYVVPCTNVFDRELDVDLCVCVCVPAYVCVCVPVHTGIMHTKT